MITGTDPHRAAVLLRAGRLVALPTETVYGLGGNALDKKAVSSIFSAKDRPSFDPLIIHQASLERLLPYVREVPALARRLAEACWPGPLTLVLPRSALVPDLVTSGLETVAVRVPSHPLTLEVLRRVDFPVAAPSANPFGFVSPVTAAHVADQLGNKLAYILDGGPCRVGLESTIVSFAVPDRPPVVLRKGGLPIERLEELAGEALEVRTHGNSRPEAPGMLSKHYSPGIRIVLLEAGERPPAGSGKERALVTFNDPEAGGGDHVYRLSASDDLAEAARNLFPVLRLLAARKYGEAYVQLVPETGLGRAINDRLRRAAASE